MGADPFRIQPENLAAERDGIIEEALLPVPGRCLIPGVARRVVVACLVLQVADAIVERGVGPLGAAFGTADRLAVELDRCTPFFPLFVLARSDFELVKRHGRPGVGCGSTIDGA